MNGDLFQDGVLLPDILVAPRTDPIYNAHGYLTKVPVDAILPYISAFTAPGGLVVDLFAGSGMTAVAARIAGRAAIVNDISVLGRHIGEAYLTEVDPSQLRAVAARAVQQARLALSDLYLTRRANDDGYCEFVRTIWSFKYACGACAREIIYFEAMAAQKWATPTECPHCHGRFDKKQAPYLGDVPVRVVVADPDGRQLEQAPTEDDLERIARAQQQRDLEKVPSITIPPEREMYRRSALKKWGLEQTRQFFSARNALALYYLWTQIQAVEEESLRRKLSFAFTAILPRASRRYQWSPQRPLNAATQNYYIAPVYFEWNVFELFERKVEAALRSDAEIAARKPRMTVTPPPEQRYVLSSSARLHHLDDCSVDYIFTDPPFGSNLFYADMSLFQEAWLGVQTDDREEAVIHTKAGQRDTAASRYEDLLKQAFSEAYRVLKPGCHLSVVFGNSSGRIWSMVQRLFRSAGFESRPVHIGILDKGQRSVKGLNSGTESVATLDLIVTVRKPESSADTHGGEPIPVTMAELIAETLEEVDLRVDRTASHIYLTILKRAFAAGLDVDRLHLSDVLAALRDRGIRPQSKSGHLEREVAGSQSSVVQKIPESSASA